MVEPEEPNFAEATKNEAVAETLKKMNKSGRTAQEKDTVDKILAEQGDTYFETFCATSTRGETQLILSKYLLINAGVAADRDNKKKQIIQCPMKIPTQPPGL